MKYYGCIIYQIIGSVVTICRVTAPPTEVSHTGIPALPGSLGIFAHPPELRPNVRWILRYWSIRARLCDWSETLLFSGHLSFSMAPCKEIERPSQAPGWPEIRYRPTRSSLQSASIPLKPLQIAVGLAGQPGQPGPRPIDYVCTYAEYKVVHFSPCLPRPQKVIPPCRGHMKTWTCCIFP